MKEACQYNNWSFVPIFLKIYRALMRWTPWSFFRGGGGDESPRWEHSPRMRSVGSGMNALSQILSNESLSYSLKHISTGGGALTSHFMEDDSSPTSIFPVFMMTSSNGNIFRVTGFVRGIHRWLLGIHRSPVNSPHTDHWRGALMLSLTCVWANGWVNNQDAGDLRRHCSHYDVTIMWRRTVIQRFGQPWDLSALKASLLSNFELVKRVKLGGSVHYGRNGLKFATLL